MGFFDSWLRNLKADQLPDGQVLNIVPKLRSYMHMHFSGSIGWGDVIVRLPWDLYQYYGDHRILSDHYEAMEKWMKHLERIASELPPEAAEMEGGKLDNQKYIINTGFHLGDWLAPSIVNEAGFADGPMSAYLTKDLVSTSLYANSAELFSQICLTLGYADKANEYQRLTERIRQAYEEEYVAEDGTLRNSFSKNQFLLAPKPNKRLSFAKASYRSVFGLIKIEWFLEADHIHFHFKVPANTQANILLPCQSHQLKTLLGGAGIAKVEREKGLILA